MHFKSGTYQYYVTFTTHSATTIIVVAIGWPKDVKNFVHLLLKWIDYDFCFIDIDIIVS